MQFHGLVDFDKKIPQSEDDSYKVRSVEWAECSESCAVLLEGRSQKTTQDLV